MLFLAFFFRLISLLIDLIDWFTDRWIEWLFMFFIAVGAQEGNQRLTLLASSAPLKCCSCHVDQLIF